MTTPTVSNSDVIISELDSLVLVIRNWLPNDVATRLFDKLREELKWKTQTILIYNKECQLPRLTYACGDGDTFTRYTGEIDTFHQWPEELKELRDRIVAETGIPFNSCMINYYRDGADHIGYHYDKGMTHLNKFTVVTVSLGGTRDFYFKRRAPLPDSSLNTIKTVLHQGDACIMTGSTQEHFTHSIPKRATASPRISLTFRYLVT